MAKTSLGKVSIVPRGTYDAATAYYPLDLVTYNGSSFLARKENTGSTPIDGEDWQLIADGKSEGTLELLQSVTLTESATANFTGLSLRYTYIEAVIPAGSSVGGQAVCFYVDGETMTLGPWIGSRSSGTRESHMMAECYLWGNHYLARYHAYAYTTDTVGVSEVSGLLSKRILPYGTITRVLYYTTLPAGSVVNLYGIRAE